MSELAQIPQTAQFEPDNGMTSVASTEVLVRHFRQILMWPLRVMPGQLEGIHISKHWELLETSGEDCPWREVQDEFDDPKRFQERHYKEFTALWSSHPQRLTLSPAKILLF